MTCAIFAGIDLEPAGARAESEFSSRAGQRGITGDRVNPRFIRPRRDIPPALLFPRVFYADSHRTSPQGPLR